MKLAIHRSYKFVQLFQVVVVRHAEKDSKEQVIYIKKNVLKYEVGFLWLGIRKYNYLIQSIRMGVVKYLGMPKVIPSI